MEGPLDKIQKDAGVALSSYEPKGLSHMQGLVDDVFDDAMEALQTIILSDEVDDSTRINAVNSLISAGNYLNRRKQNSALKM